MARVQAARQDVTNRRREPASWSSRLARRMHMAATMLELASLALVFGFFVLSFGLAELCERLQG
jgi:hypothetical protein